MNRSSLRKVAASVATVCDQNGGSVDVFFLMKALYLADREMIIDYGVPITGDNYSSMPKGPILSATYDFARGKSNLTTLQSRWNQAFVTNGDTISPRGKIDTSCLSPVEEAILRSKIKLVMDLAARQISVADWTHKNCPEWEAVPEGSSKPLPLERVLRFANEITAEKAKSMEAEIEQALLTRQESLLSKQPLVMC